MNIIDSKLNIFNVKEYGAKGNNLNNDTCSIQKTINACNKAGGGIVYFPPGIYFTATIYLKDNVTIYLENGATIQGSDNLDDYSPIHLIYAKNCKNISIAGNGYIDCNSRGFVKKIEKVREKNLEWKAPWGDGPWRPRCTVHFFCCENVTISGVKFSEGGITTICLIGCKKVNIHKIIIENDLNIKYPADGINILSCQGVCISNCSISTQDDPICIYQGCPWFEHPLGKDLEDLSDEELEFYPNENILVTNCTLRTECNGIRINGSRGGAIRNVIFSNIVIESSAFAINIANFYQLASGREIFQFKQKATEINNIRFSNIIAYSTGFPFVIRNENVFSGDGIKQGNITNISINNSQFYTDMSYFSKNACCFISGSPEQYLENIDLENIKIEVRGKLFAKDNKHTVLCNDDVFYPFEFYRHEVFPEEDNRPYQTLPFGIYCRNIKNLYLNNIRINWHKETSGWENALRCENIFGVILNHIYSPQYDSHNPKPLIYLKNTSNASIHACFPVDEKKSFLKVIGDMENVKLL